MQHKSSPQLYQQAVSYHQQGYLEQAILLYQKLLYIEPTNAELCRLLAMAMWQDNRIAQALAQLHKAQAIEPDNALIWSNLGLIHQHQGYIEKALSCYQKSIVLQPSASVYSNLGIIYQQRNNSKQAIHYLQLAHQAAPTSIEIICNLIVSLRSNKNFEQATVLCQQAIRLQPSSPRIHYEWAETLAAMYRWKEALQAAQKSLAFDNNYILGLVSTARILHRLQQAEEAFDLLEKAILLAPQHAEAYEAFGSMLRQQNQIQAAIATFTEGLRHSPSSIKLKLQLAISYDMSDRVAAARQLFEELISLEHVPNEQLIHCGHFFLKQGENQKAQQIYQHCLQRQPQDKEARHFLAICEQRSLARMDRSYISQIFDDAALSFDNHLLQELAYQTPLKLHQLALEEGLAKLDRALDLGCGTGLLGKLFRPHCEFLIGLDLSEQMLKQAEKKQLYQQLICADIIDYLPQHQQSFQLVIASDVLNYTGDLTPMMQLIYHSLQASGWWLFSTEHSQHEEFFLQNNGRFAHSDQHVMKTAKLAGFQLRRKSQVSLRQEFDVDVQGCLYLFEKLQ